MAEVVDFAAHLVNHLTHGEGLEEQLAVGNLAGDGGCRAVGHEGGHALGRDVGEVVLENVGRDAALGLDDGNLLGDVLELAHVAVPGVVHEHGACVLGEDDGRHVVFLGHVGGKFSKKQRDVLLAFAEGRQVDGELVEAIVEVLAEAALADGADDVDIGGGDDADVNLLGRGATHGDNLAVLEDAEKLDLHGQGQLANLVEEDGAAVGLFEIALARTVGAGEGSLHMAEELALDGALGDGTAVDGDEAATLTHMLASAVLVDDAREDILAHAALAGDEDGEVGGCHLDGLVEGHEELGVVADDIVALL